MVEVKLDFNETDTSWINQKFIMLGEPKVGKTHYWAMGGEKTFFIKTEQGHNHVKHMGANCTSLQDIYEVRDQIMKLMMKKQFPCDTIVIDTGDRWLQYIDNDVVDWGIKKYTTSDINGIGDIPNGNGWRNRTVKMSTFLSDFESLPCAIVIIFHVISKPMEDEKGKAYERSTINVGGKAANAILGWSDHIMHVKNRLVGEIQVRKVMMRENKHTEAGSRMDGIIPPSLDWGKDAKVNYDNFRKYFT